VSRADAQHGTRLPTIPQVAKTAGQFTTLLAAVDAAGLTETLPGRGPFTLFAPTDEAFNRLPSGTVKDLLKDENRDTLRTILTYHVVSGRVTAGQASSLRSAETVAGQSVRISRNGDDLRINDATVRIADIPASNGIVHVIDRVLLPSERRMAASGSPLEVIELAIERGVPLFNNGQVDATIATYEVASTALLASGAAVPEEARQALRRSLADTRGDNRDRAFALRFGLDEARQQLTARMDSGSRR
jgi:uncharacterized surface protein with fasciclin (FAS1) repeats